MESLNSMQLLSVSTAALMSSLLKPNKRTTLSGRKCAETEEAKEEEGEEKEEKKEDGETDNETDMMEDAEHIHFLKQVRLE